MKNFTQEEGLRVMHTCIMCRYKISGIVFDKADDNELFNWLIPPVSRLQIVRRDFFVLFFVAAFVARLTGSREKKKKGNHARERVEERDTEGNLLCALHASLFNWKPKKQREIVKNELIYRLPSERVLVGIYIPIFRGIQLIYGSGTYMDESLIAL